MTENVWNVRANFKVFSLLSIGTHMSFMRVSSGRFLVIDTVPLDPELKAEIDQLTNQGLLIEAVIATHPFHTLSFAAFYEAYPNARYFGTPRHIRVVPQIPWVGDIRDHLLDWAVAAPPPLSSSSSSSTVATSSTDQTTISSIVESFGAAPTACSVQMRIPDGAEYVNPLPEISNHFVSVFVYHVTDRVLHVDDTLNLYNGDVSFLLRLVGVAPGRFSFHPAIKGPGLHPTERAPLDFLSWMQALLEEWDIDVVCCAHRDVQTHSCQQMLQAALDEIKPALLKISRNNAKKNKGKGSSNDQEAIERCSQFNVAGAECG